jgi:hypothetical protein
MPAAGDADEVREPDQLLRLVGKLAGVDIERRYPNAALIAA